MSSEARVIFISRGNLKVPVIVVSDDQEAARFCSDPPPRARDDFALFDCPGAKKAQWLVEAVAVSREVDDAAPGCFGPPALVRERFRGRPGRWWLLRESEPRATLGVILDHGDEQ